MSRPSRGFTLIELMLAVGIASIVGVTFFGVMYMQTITYVQRLDELDAHANARAALNVIRRYARNARWGMVSGSTGAGTVGIGKCYNSALPSQSMGACNNLSSDSGADRMRAVYIINDTEYVGNQNYGSSSNCVSGLFDSSSYVHVNQAPVRLLTANTIIGIGGICVGANPPAASDVMILTGDSPGANCSHRYAFTMLEGTTLSCGNGYDKGFSFGRAVVADFYILKDATGRPQLMMRTDPTVAPAKGSVVAYGIEDMQIRYGVDTSFPSDRSVDVWCDDPRIVSDGGNCDTKQTNTGTAYATADNYNRIIAIQVTLRVRTDSPRPSLNVLPLDPNLTLANPVTNPKDGYQRWIYSTTIALRNDNI